MSNIQDLFNIIQNLSNKIDNLENKIDELNQQIQQKDRIKNNTVIVVPNYIPSILFQKWLQTFDINKQDIMVLLETNILDGFKACIIKHISGDKNDTISKPMCISNSGRYKQIYIYDIVDCLDQDAQWRIMTEDDIHLLIDTLWRKMIEYYFVTEEETIQYILSDNEQTQRDMNKKILLDSKKRLLKYTKEIQRCIIERCFV